MLFLGGWGKMIREKNLMHKISWHCPFQRYLSYTMTYKVQPRED